MKRSILPGQVGTVLDAAKGPVIKELWAVVSASEQSVAALDQKTSIT